MGRLYYSKQHETVCDGLEADIFEQEKYDHVEEDYLPPWIIANRGECSFVDKVRNMEDSGAALGIIVDNFNENVTQIVMTDEGSGAGLRIHSMLV